MGRSWMAAVLALALTAAACGGGGEDDDASDSTASEQVTTTAGSESTTGASTDGTGAPTSAPDTAAPTEQPRSGGKLRVGVEAETAQPFTPANMQCDGSCHFKVRSVFEPLVAFDADGVPRPYLAESVEPNADFTEWTIKLREGITFHDGTPLDADAVIDNLDRAINSFLIGAVLAPVASTGSPKVGEFTKVDDLTVTVGMTEPWAEFPGSGLATQAGFMASPAWLAAVDADGAKATEPVGTGPFMYKSFSPGSSFVVTRNPTYWQSDEFGTQLPYLDEIEFRVIVDTEARADALKAGDVDVIGTTNGPNIAEFREQSDEFAMVEQTGETTYVLLKVSEAGGPLADRRVRCGMSAAVDKQLVVDVLQDGINQIANGPFTPNQAGYLEDNGATTFDPDAARDLIAAYTAENGQPVISYMTTNDQSNLTMVELLAAAWEDVGVKVDIRQTEQGALITSALVGAPEFQAFLWRNHAGTLDRNLLWWSSDQAHPEGELALNFGRVRDDRIDALLEENRGTDDPARKQEIAQEVNRIFGEECYIIPVYWTIWGIAYQRGVAGLEEATIPGTTDLLAGVQDWPGQLPFVRAWLRG